MTATPDTPAMTSPCVGICVAHDGFCIGCKRSLSEIAAWRMLSEAERLRIMREELPQRRSPISGPDACAS